MATIRILPPEVVNRIAAGEVVERPASIVKELIENAIDAHATEISVDLVDGGKTRVTVQDNGCGMDSGDLPLAVHSHATSKLGDHDLEKNLVGVATLGFRGEALASIASVSELEILSRPAASAHAHRLRLGRREASARAARAMEPEPAAGEPGSVVEVRDLFYNVPARRKFLRSNSTELSHVLDHVTRIALGFPGVRFRVTQGKKILLDLPACDSLRDRVTHVAGSKVRGELLEVEESSAAGSTRLVGYVGSPRLRRTDARGQHFIVNGRWVRDRLLSHALRSAFQGFLIPGNQPVAYLYLDLPPDAVDVNVHPTKTEVRFRSPGEVYPLVRNAVRAALEGEAGSREAAEPLAHEEDTEAPPAATRGRYGQRVMEAALDYLRGPSPPETPRGAAARTGAGGRTLPVRPPESWFAVPDVGVRRAMFQVLDSFIVVEEEDGLAIIDQHALHEKVLFERILRGLQEGEVLRQRLLVPLVVSVPIDLLPLVGSLRDVLRPCGFEVETFGDREIALHAVPEVLEGKGGGRYEEIILELLRTLRDEGETAFVLERDRPQAEDVLSGPYRKVASFLACKRAVKAGMRLAPEELKALVDRAALADDPRHCPHGRPTVVRLSRRELERRFDRK